MCVCDIMSDDPRLGIPRIACVTRWKASVERNSVETVAAPHDARDDSPNFLEIKPGKSTSDLGECSSPTVEPRWRMPAAARSVSDRPQYYTDAR